jgi:hypothetical protein
MRNIFQIFTHGGEVFKRAKARVNFVMVLETAHMPQTPEAGKMWRPAQFIVE